MIKKIFLVILALSLLGAGCKKTNIAEETEIKESGPKNLEAENVKQALTKSKDELDWHYLYENRSVDYQRYSLHPDEKNLDDYILTKTYDDQQVYQQHRNEKNYDQQVDTKTLAGMAICSLEAGRNMQASYLTVYPAESKTSIGVVLKGDKNCDRNVKIFNIFWSNL